MTERRGQKQGHIYRMEFNKSDIYDKVIKEKITELKKLCNQERMPMFVAVCTENTEKGTRYEADIVGSYSNDIILKNDLIPKFINVFNGFDTVPHEDVTEILVDDTPAAHSFSRE